MIIQPTNTDPATALMRWMADNMTIDQLADFKAKAEECLADGVPNPLAKGLEAFANEAAAQLGETPHDFTITVIDCGVKLSKNNFPLGTYPNDRKAKVAAIELYPLLQTKKASIITEIPMVIERNGGK